MVRCGYATGKRWVVNCQSEMCIRDRALGEAEKRDLAACLTRALHRARNPVFDNPQLRE